MMQRVADLIQLDPEFESIQVEVGPPFTTWQDSDRYILIARCTGNIDNARFGRPNPTWDDHANIEIWAQGFASDSMESADLAETAMSMAIAAVSSNRQLALNDTRLEGVQTSWFTELDGPMFLADTLGVIVSYRAILHVQTLVRTP
jgi:hypothetical protein